MSAAGINIPQCCTPCSGTETVQVPGAPGNNGNDGQDGADGQDAYTTLTAGFTMPDKADEAAPTVSITVGSTAFMDVGMILFIAGAGYMQVVSITDINNVVVTNLENGTTGAYADNAEPLDAIPSGGKVVPSGPQGVGGDVTYAAAGDIELDGGGDPRLAITAAFGDLIVNNNDTFAPRNGALSVGADGTVLHCDSGSAMGRVDRGIDLTGVNTVLTGTLPVASGGTGGANAGAARAALSAAALGANSDITSLAGLTTPLTVAQGGTGVAVWPVVMANRNGTDQASNGSGTDILLQLTTEELDLGSYFVTGAGTKYTPLKAGTYKFSISVKLIDLGDGQSLTVKLFKNGAAIKQVTVYNTTGGDENTQAVLDCLAIANGSTDYFEPYFYFTAAAPTTKDVEGATTDTWFHAFRAGPSS